MGKRGDETTGEMKSAVKGITTMLTPRLGSLTAHAGFD